MKSCPACGRESMELGEDRSFKCGACDTVVFHEGNGYVVEPSDATSESI